MAFSTQRAVSDGSLVYLDLSIGYQSRNDIKVFINDLPTPPGRWAWVGVSDKRISFTPAVAAGQEVLVQRSTRLDRIINVFARGAKFNNSTLDMNFEQALFLAQEAIEGSALSDIYNDVDFHGYRLKNVSWAQADADAVPLIQVVQMSQGAWAARVDAVNAANLSVERAGLAAQYMEGGRQYSIQSANWAAASQQSAVNADASRANAAQSRDAAAVSASQAIGAAAPAAGIYSRLGAAETVANEAKTQAANAASALSAKVNNNNQQLNITWWPGPLTENGGLRLVVDQTPMNNTWPINVLGRAGSAGSADSSNYAANAGYASNAGYATNAGSASSAVNAQNAGFATNANNLGGRSYTGWVQNASPGNVISWAWDGYATVSRVDGNVQYAWTEWGRVVNRPTQVSSFGNDMRYAPYQGQFGMLQVAAADGTQFAGWALPVDAGRIGRIGVISGGLYATADGQAFSWPINPSDARLKKDITPALEDSLDKIRRMVFKSFTYNEVSPMMAGIKRKNGLIAQELDEIDPEFITYAGDFRQLNTEVLLTAALQAIQQLDAEVQRLKKE